MSTPFVAVVSLLLGACAATGWYVTNKMLAAAIERPFIPSLMASVVSSAAMAVGATTGFALGLSRLGVLPEFPEGVSIGLLVLTVLIPSSGNLAKLWLLRKLAES